LSEDERPTARDKVTNEMRQKISAMLTPEQKVKYQQMVQAQTLARQQAGGAAAAGSNSAGAPGSSNTTKSIAPQSSNTPATAKKQGEKDASAPVAAGMTPAAGAAKPAAPTAPAVGAAADPGAAAASGSGAGAGGNNPATQFRNRLVAELALTAPQIEKVDAIYADARPKMMGLRDLPQEERGKARERISAEIRAKLRELMTPEQKPKFDAIVAESASRQSTRGRIYLMGADGKPKAYNVRLGISDGTSTELIVLPNSPDAAELVEGAMVIIGTVNTGSTAGGSGGGSQRPAGASGPRMAF
jgi:HlyD family secretion protein